MSLIQARILVIDDESKITDEISKELGAMGYSTDTYNDPDLVLTSFKSGQYDLIIMDVGLPQMDGYALFRKIRDLDGDAKICLMSDSIAHDHEFLTLFPIWKARDYFHKPIRFSDMVELVTETMKYRSI